jgi:hypothetical protein
MSLTTLLSYQLLIFSLSSYISSSKTTGVVDLNGTELVDVVPTGEGAE